MTTIALPPEAAELARGGTFVRVEIGGWATLDDGTRFRSALVARLASRRRSRPGAETAARAGTWVGYANLCRHHPVELDVPDMRHDPRTGVRLALLGEDGVSLMCASHGALYRPDDGFCRTGPCFGQSLACLAVTGEDAAEATGTPVSFTVTLAGTTGGDQR